MDSTTTRILVVEDEAIVAMDISRRLERLGYQVTGSAASGEDALSQINSDTPDLVLMDIRLAGRMDGIETALLVRQHYALPIIFLTAHTDTSTLERAKTAEPYGYIVKPLETTQLATTITMALYKHQMEMRVKASEAKFRQLAEVNPAAMAIIQPAQQPDNYEVLYANPALRVLVESENHQARLAPDALGQLLPDDQFTLLNAALKRVFSGLTSKAELEIQIMTGDGQARWLAVTVVEIAYEGQPAVMLTGVDLTHQREAEQERIELALEKERRRFLQAIMDDFSHDFRNPLSAIRASVYLMKQLNDPKKTAEYQGMIETQVHHLEEMVEDIMHMSRLEMQAALRFEAVSVEEIVREVINSQIVATQDKGQALCLLGCPAGIRVMADRTQFFRALANILANSVRYTPAGGQITVGVKRHANEVEIEVCDSGIGIEQEDLPHIFERFYRAPQAKAFSGSGTGLGLAITKKIVELHKGSIAVSSKPGQGSIFQISLPVAHHETANDAIRQTCSLELVHIPLAASVNSASRGLSG